MAREAMGYDDPDAFFSDLFEHGCVSGMVGSLVYYTQTRAFFILHYDEIEELRLALMEDGIMPDRPEQDLCNFLSWLAFEEKARQLVHEILELDL